MRRFLRFCPVLLLAALTVAVSGCGGGSGTPPSAVADGEPISFEALAEAGRASADATSGRFAFSLEMTMPGTDEPLAFAGDGAFDSLSNRASLTLDFSAFAEMFAGLAAGLGASADGPDLGDASDWRIEALQDGTIVYLNFPLLADRLPGGKSWVRVDLSKAASIAGFDFTRFQDMADADPRKALDYLKALSGDLETVGSDTLRGVKTMHYRATIDLTRYQQLVPAKQREELGAFLDQIVEEAGIRHIPVDVWIDEFGLVRQFELAFTASDPASSQELSVSMMFELFDYGKEVSLDLPPAADVVDVAALR